jgi:hypothetical protein
VSKLDLRRTLQELIEQKPEYADIANQISDKYQEDLNTPPRIAIFGATGVGKSTTINQLFGTNLPVSHTRAGTHAPIDIKVSLDGELIQGAKGDLIIYDMPGIGEDIGTDEGYKKLYAEIAGQCDVAVWVVSAVDRRSSEDQRIISNVLSSANKELVDRLVIGINKIDQVHPADWNTRANIPSKMQDKNIQERAKDIKQKFIKVCPGLTEDRIIPYSATKRYRLVGLFGAMLEACPQERAWVLYARENIADFKELVDPELRAQVQAKISGDA